MKTSRGFPVLVSILSGLLAACGPMPEEGSTEGGGEAVVEGAEGGEGGDATVSAESLGTDNLWEVCSNEAQRVRNIGPGSTGAALGAPVAGDGLLFFSANDVRHGQELWASAGKGKRTFLVKDIEPEPERGSSPRFLTRLGKWVFFVAAERGHGLELWRSDGTAKGTVLVKDVWPGPAGSNPEQLTVVGDLLYFTANDPEHGEALWRTDGTAKGTVLVRDFNPGSALSFYPTLASLTAWEDEGRLVLVHLGESETVLWAVDRKGRASRLLTEGFVAISEIVPAGRQLFFLVDEDFNDADLWVTGREPGTASRVRRIPGEPPALLTALGDSVFFVAGGESLSPGDPHGVELWRSDGTAKGTGMVKDIQPGDRGSMPASLVVMNGALYFTADDGEHGRELWRSGGEDWSTWQVKDLAPGSAGSDPENLTVEKGYLFFSAVTEGRGREAWYTQGWFWETRPVWDIAPEEKSSFPGSFVRSGQELFFLATDGANDRELYSVPFRPARRCDRGDC